jgi:hypothetical protein
VRGLLAGFTFLVAGSVLAPVFLRDPRAKAWIKAHAPNPFEQSDTLDERRARALFDLNRVGDRLRYDPVAWLELRPDLDEEVHWDEHPRGSWRLRTNDVGLRADAPVGPKRGPRVLVLGDSHTSGLVSNDESFATLLEGRLAVHANWQGVDVLNAGVPYTGPRTYLQTLEKRRALAPDVVVAVCFTGNDFWDDLKTNYLLEGWTPPVGDAPYRQRIESVAARWPGPASQGFNQAYRFRAFPWEVEKSLALATASFRALQARCSELSLRLLVVVLPTKMEVEPEDDREVQEAVRAALELTPDDLELLTTLGQRLAANLRAAGLEVVEPLEAMRAAEHPLYWRTDYHLGMRGHAWLAAELERVLAAE